MAVEGGRFRACGPNFRRKLSLTVSTLDPFLPEANGNRDLPEPRAGREEARRKQSEVEGACTRPRIRRDAPRQDPGRAQSGTPWQRPGAGTPAQGGARRGGGGPALGPSPPARRGRGAGRRRSRGRGRVCVGSAAGRRRRGRGLGGSRIRRGGAGRDGCSASAAPLGAAREAGRVHATEREQAGAQRGRGASRTLASACFHPWGMIMRLGLALVLGVALCLGFDQLPLWAPERPFSVLWNIPSAHCKTRFGVHLPLEALGITANRGQRFRGQNITIFYKNQLGLYPYLGPRGITHNGGIPQVVPLDRHLARAAYQIHRSLGRGFTGLAVLDWEEWSPLWAGNWGRRRAYQAASWAWAQRVFPHLDPQEQFHKARAGFERAARALMEDTLRLGQALQPHGFWGFYRFPACSNGWHGTASNYTGHCHPAALARNTQLHWLWAASSALFPSIYLPPRLPPTHHQAFVRYRLEEAFRVAFIGHPHPLPVLAYARLTYRSTGRFLSQDDLVQTIGVSAALGAAGVVLWGDLSFSSSEEKCWHLRDYLVDTLGPYVINVTRAAIACSHQQCHGHGRCAWQDGGQLEAFLHLQPDGSPGAWESFSCRCYPGWAGPTCQEPRPAARPE
nr:hyaluronidase-3 isoform X1 [Vulpes vulpes]